MDAHMKYPNLYKSIAIACLGCLGARAAWPQAFNLFQPATGVLVGSTTTYVTTAAASSNIVALWTGTCNSTSFLRGDGACIVGNVLATPVSVANGGTGATTLTGVLKGNGASAFTAAAGSDILPLFEPAADTVNSLGFGTNSLSALTNPGNFDTAFGQNALAAVTTGNQSTAVGGGALQAATTGGFNTAVGVVALGALTTGSSNTAVGKALLAVVTGSNNTAVGDGALAVTTGSFNTAVGQSAGAAVSTTSVGVNILFGYQAGNVITTGARNIVVGQAGNITTGSSNVLLGNSLTLTTATVSNQLDIADAITATDYTVGPMKLRGGEVSTGTTFTITSGCATVSALTGGATAGTFATTTTGVCTPVIALPTAPNGWACQASDLNRANVFTQTARTTTSCTVSGTTVSGDTVIFMAIGF
jgi:hypothetical protein